MTMSRSTILAVCLLAPAGAAKADTAIVADYTGTVSGVHTTDKIGLFGPKGASLAGKTIQIHTQYVAELLPTSGECRTHACTYDSSAQQPGTSGSVETSITIGGKTVVYAPTSFSTLFFGIGNNTYFVSDSDANSGFGIGLRGCQLSVTYTAPVIFGQPFDKNGNAPVQNDSAVDYIYFYGPNDQLPIEKITFGITASSSPAR